MLRGDASGRSFYIRVRDDVAEANLEAATAAVPDASRMLQQQRAAAGCGASAAAAAAAGVDPAVALEPQGAPRMYFWLSDRDLGRAVYSLGRLKSLLKRPPTLSKRSGVPERQLAQLGAWVQRADQAAAEQQRAAAQQEQGLQWEEGTGPAAAQPHPDGDGALGSSRARPLPPLLQGGPVPGLLLGQPGGMAAAAHLQGGMAALLSPAPPPAQQAGAGSPGEAVAPSSSGSGAPLIASSTATVSATAAALYQDHRFNVVCPCTIRWVLSAHTPCRRLGAGRCAPSGMAGLPCAVGHSCRAPRCAAHCRSPACLPCPACSVMVGLCVQAAGADPAALHAESSCRARAVAERQAKAAVDRSGRQHIEERLAEVVIRNIRAQRNRARQARQAQRDSAARAAAAERALALARHATGRLGPLPAPAGPQATPPASPVAASAAALLPLDAEQATGGSFLPLTGAGPLARCSSADSELAGACCPCQEGSGGSRPASPPAAAPLLPSGRVTIGNLQSILAQPQALEAGSRAQQGSSAPSAGSAPAAAAGAAGAANKPASRVTVGDLADLLGKHAKLE